MSLAPQIAPVDIVATALSRAGLDPAEYHLADLLHDLRDDSALPLREAVHTSIFLRLARDNRRR